MNKTTVISVFCFLLTTSLFFGQNWIGQKIKGNGNIKIENRTTPTYDIIKMQGTFDVDLIAGIEGNITVTADENLMQFIKLVVENGVLKIYEEKGKSLHACNGNKILITVPFDKIVEFSLSGSGNVKANNVINTEKFVAILSGSGDIILDMVATEIDAKISGSGNIILSGKANNLTAKISGSGDVRASELVAVNADVSISGSGNINIDCTDNLSAKISGSGNIYYKNEPKNKDAKVSGSGTIKMR